MTFRNRRHRHETLEMYRAAFRTFWERKLANRARKLWRKRLLAIAPDDVNEDLRVVLAELQRGCYGWN